MKKIIAVLIVLSTLLSLMAISASALFEPMDIEEMKTELEATPSESGFKGMAFAWEFDDVTTETKEYTEADGSVTTVENTVKNGDYTGKTFDTILSGAYESVKEGSVGGVQFKNYDSAIRAEYGEIIFSAAHKNADDASFGSTDAYLDVYTTDVGFDQAHEAHAGDSFVMSARLRAPFGYDNTPSGTMELFRTRSSSGSGADKITIDTILLKYNVQTHEVTYNSNDTFVGTGIYLSDYDYTTVAVFVKPTENTYDVYADGIRIVKDATFLNAKQASQVRASNTGVPTGNTADYTLTRMRLFYTGVKLLTADLLCIDNFVWYFADEYLEKSEYSDTVIAKSVDIGDKFYLNVYMNLPLCTLYDYNATIDFSVDGKTVSSLLLMSGEIVKDGEYAGLVKYSAPIEISQLSKPVTLSLSSMSTSEFYLYEEVEDGFCGVESYTTSLVEYFEHLMNKENGFGAEIRALSRAVLNYATYAQLYYDEEAGVKTDTDSLPNKNCAYTSEEISAVSADILRASVENPDFAEYTTYGAIDGFTLSRNALLFDNGIYLEISYSYVGMKALEINGGSAAKTGKFVVSLDSVLNLNDVYTVTFGNGVSYFRMKISPLHLAANIISSQSVSESMGNFIRALYLYTEAFATYKNADK